MNRAVILSRDKQSCNFKTAKPEILLYVSLRFMSNTIQLKWSAKQGAVYSMISIAAACFWYLPPTNIKASPICRTTKNASGICLFITCSHSSLSRITTKIFCVDENIPLWHTKLIHVCAEVQNIDSDVIHQCRTMSCYRIMSYITRITLWYQRCYENVNVLVEKTSRVSHSLYLLTYLFTYLLTHSLLTYLLTQ